MYSSKIHTRNGTLFAVPSVAPEGMVMLCAPVTTPHTGVPVVNVVDRNGIDTGLVEDGVEPLAPVTVIVSALAEAEADKPKFTGTVKP